MKNEKWSFKGWLEDTGEVRTALLTNDPLGMPSKYVQSQKWNKQAIRNPFCKRKGQKENKEK